MNILKTKRKCLTGYICFKKKHDSHPVIVTRIRVYRIEQYCVRNLYIEQQIVSVIGVLMRLVSQQPLVRSSGAAAVS